jgi:hypothetical protein
MKEYIIIPKVDYEKNIKKCDNEPVYNTADSTVPKNDPMYHEITNIKRRDDILQSGEIPQEIMLNLYDRLKHIDTKDVSQKKKQDDDMIDVRGKKASNTDILNTLITYLPEKMQDKAKQIINILHSLDNYKIDSSGQIFNTRSNTGIRIDVFMRTLLVKNAKISHVVDFLKDIIQNIPADVINNKKVLSLKMTGGGLNTNSRWYIY